jgi:hypothetical protein
MAFRDTVIIELRGQPFLCCPEVVAFALNLEYKVPELSDAEWQKIIDFASKYNIRWLLLSCNRIRAIPETISTLTNLQQLDLEDNKIRAIPETISTLTNLQQLDLGRNKIRMIPESIAALVNLRSLSLKRNKIDDVPDVLAKMRKLKSLRINKNPFIEKIPFSFRRGERFTDWCANYVNEVMCAMPIITYFKQHRVTRMAAIALVWKFLPMPIAEEIEPHVTEIDLSNEKKRNAVAEVNPKRRRINK